MENWLRQVFMVISTALSVLTGGWADETLSARSFRLEQRQHWFGRLLRPVIDALFMYLPARVSGGPAHCQRAAKFEASRRLKPPEFR